MEILKYTYIIISIALVYFLHSIVGLEKFHTYQLVYNRTSTALEKKSYIHNFFPGHNKSKIFEPMYPDSFFRKPIRRHSFPLSSYSYVNDQ